MVTEPNENFPWQKLLDWHRQRSPYPWSNLSDPYPVWVSEAMLQQTTAATVKNRFTAWFEVFPTVEDLARAEEGQVLKAWEGLGYYGRARHLYRAAQAIVRDGWPDSPQAWQTLPGVGPYAARAISSFTTDYPTIAFDTNIRRILCRLEGQADWDKKVEELWEDRFQHLFERGVSSKQINAALMRLGQEVCRRRSPDCPSCPLAEACQARQQNTQSLIPHAPPKPTPVHEELYPMFLIRRSTQALLLEKSATSRFQGQYLPRFGSREWWRDYEAHYYLGSFRHTVTHHRYRLECWAAFTDSDLNGNWVPVRDLEHYPMPSIYRKIVVGPLLTFCRQVGFPA